MTTIKLTLKRGSRTRTDAKARESWTLWEERWIDGKLREARAHHFQSFEEFFAELGSRLNAIDQLPLTD